RHPTPRQRPARSLQDYGQDREPRSFPTRRSSDLGDPGGGLQEGSPPFGRRPREMAREARPLFFFAAVLKSGRASRAISLGLRPKDRKSTRLNSSHDQISYAVFCLIKINGAFVHRA